MRKEHFDSDEAARPAVTEMLDGTVKIERGLGLFLGPGGVEMVLLAPGFERPFEEESKNDITLDWVWNIAVGSFEDKPYANAVFEASWPEEGKGMKLLFDLLDEEGAFAVLGIGAFGGNFSIVESAEDVPAGGGFAVLENLVGFQTNPEDATFEIAVGIAIRTLEAGGAVEKLAELLRTGYTGAQADGPLADFAGPLH